MQKQLFAIGLCAILAASCASQSLYYRTGEDCIAGTFTVSDQFAGARRGRCSVVGDNHIRLRILPEDDGYINDSPWYSFKIRSQQTKPATITLTYVGGHHRYIPKISSDGLHWRALDDANISVSEDKTSVDIIVPLDDALIWVSGQELITPLIYDLWNQKMVRQSGVALSVLGESLGKLPISLLTSEADSDDVLLLVGRQHPPEVTGALAFFSFYETLMADTELAAAFRRRVQIVAVPMMNPDGIIGGNWRHNLDGADLNRDWGPFKQPETQAIAGLLDQLDADGKNIRVFLDFHSTQRNVFYTQDEDSEHTPPRFTRRWLENARPRISALTESYEYENQENPTDTLGVSKNYMYHRYGIPASTYELGDETDRVAIRKASVIFAEELMKLMLEQNY